MPNPVVQVQALGQSIWFDNIRRGLILSGELQELVAEGGVLGVTSNPAIFEKAVAGSTDYDPALQALVRQGVGDAKDLYERLAIEDIQLTADVLRPIWERTTRRDGYISLEVSPYLAHDTEGTVEEGRRLHDAIGRDNVMIKVPATDAGLPAIRTLIADGIPVNVTLIFSKATYERVADVYMSGLEDRQARGEDLHVESVASVFISRVDSLVDAELKRGLDATQDAAKRKLYKDRLGNAAIANARLCYGSFLHVMKSERWSALEADGARNQRLLWASTGVKDPAFSKTRYVDELIGKDTVNTVPTETYRLFREDGTASTTLPGDFEALEAEAQSEAEALDQLGISLEAVGAELLDAGAESFSEAFDKLLGAVECKRQTLLGTALAHQESELGEAEAAVTETLAEWRQSGKHRALWAGDAALWTGADEADWLGWLHVVGSQRDEADELQRIASKVRQDEIKHVVLLGMGGSSLCPEVLWHTFGPQADAPELIVLDSILPDQIRSVEARIDLARTLFLVSSKSGGTSETATLRAYFMERVGEVIGSEQIGSRFVAVTDPGTSLRETAKQAGFRHIFRGEPSIGGRYSALSAFGTVPAAMMGLDVRDLMDRAEQMVLACESCVPPESNPGLVLGATLGTLAKQGRNKLTLITTPAISGLGAWVEQLVAESTGKLGLGIVPIDGERLTTPDRYGDDRLFVYARLEGDASPEQDAGVAALAAAGHPVVRLSIADPMDIGQAFFRWEFATAVAGAILGINPFDQPDVEAAKNAARSRIAAFEESGTLGEEEPLAQDGPVRLYADAKNAEALRTSAGSDDAVALLRAHIDRIGENDYVAVNAYVERCDDHDHALQHLRHTLRNWKNAATTLGYGPRFLHSTGQLHKGGPDSGVFLHITADPGEDIAVPGQRATFGVLARAQAAGDHEVLAERGRRVLRIDLGDDVGSGLAHLMDMVERSTDGE
ncbi:MAG: bifunctional transaldolase/phosoglucose isomerase [bacterium]|nr:bifunctional transaldolase/phosoglucose isomerase [bacterium]